MRTSSPASIIFPTSPSLNSAPASRASIPPETIPLHTASIPNIDRNGWTSRKSTSRSTNLNRLPSLIVCVRLQIDLNSCGTPHHRKHQCRQALQVERRESHSLVHQGQRQYGQCRDVGRFATCRTVDCRIDADNFIAGSQRDVSIVENVPLISVTSAIAGIADVG